MKTGGTSFTAQFNANFTLNQRYPDAYMASNDDIFRRMEAYLHVPRFVEDVNAMNGKLRLVSGHIPYATRSLLHHDYVAITMLRDPIERTLSYLQHCRQYHPEHSTLTLEQIYDDPWFFASFISNYQTKIFSMSAEEALSEERMRDGSPILPPRRELGYGENLPPSLAQFRDRSPGRFTLETVAASTGVITIDDRRLQRATENLNEVDLVGVTERHDPFILALAERYGWKLIRIGHQHVGERDKIASSFRQRIATDNAYDVELYEYAKSLSP